MFFLKMFLDQFVFIWGCEHCYKTFGVITPSSHYYLKNLKYVYYACYGLFYKKENQMLLIDDEPTKVFQNPKWSGLFSNLLKDNCCKKNGSMVGLVILFLANFD